MEEASSVSPTKGNFAVRLKRTISETQALLARWWSTRWGRRGLLAAGAFFLFVMLFWLAFARGLPDAAALADYEPPLPTVVRDVNGQLIHSYARENRVQLQYDDYPAMLIRAYLAAEDKTFFTHHGVDFTGLAGAVVDYAMKIGTGARARGGSTITQQVAKNLLIGDAYSPTRKIKEMILAYRIENALTKQQILELYLNQIFLGRNAYGVQAASRAYFDKDVGDLKLHEMAYLAILPKGPANYRPESPTGHKRALERRNWALGEMLENGWISDAQYRGSIAQPLGTVSQRGSPYGTESGGYYVEEVRRRLIDLYGEAAKDGANSVYAGGLWVRSPLNPVIQDSVTTALRDGLLRFDTGRGWSGPVGKVDADGNWKRELAGANIGLNYANWKVAVVLSREADAVRIGFADGRTGIVPAGYAQLAYSKLGVPAFAALKAGDLIVVQPEGAVFALRNVPEVSGGMTVEGTHNGRVYAMQGGFDAKLSSYNRATQAQRQPGSTIKPFVYAAALDNGMTPSSIIVDGPFCIDQGGNLGQKCFKNFTGDGAGPRTMRWGIEQSRNLMTVRAASQTGMDRVVRTIKGMGIGDYQPYLAFALGAGETTVERMVNAYAMLANQGHALSPKLIDYVQDRHGQVIWPENWRPCRGCNGPDWDGRPMPRFGREGKQVMNPMTAYQVIHITEGVIQRGTATVLRDLNRPLFGKTGTTNGPTNVWFVGGSPDIVAGVYLGYDTPRSLGGYAQGGRIAAPIWKQAMAPILAKMPKTPFIAPAGIRMVRVERRSGKRVYGEWPTDDPLSPVIWEAFKPETEPRRTLRKEELAGQQAKSATAVGAAPSDSEFLQREGGIY